MFDVSHPLNRGELLLRRATLAEYVGNLDVEISVPQFQQDVSLLDDISMFNMNGGHHTIDFGKHISLYNRLQGPGSLDIERHWVKGQEARTDDQSGGDRDELPTRSRYEMLS